LIDGHNSCVIDSQELIQTSNLSYGYLIRCSELDYDSDDVAAVTDDTYARMSDAIAAQP